jgi:hypothetical protein
MAGSEVNAASLPACLEALIFLSQTSPGRRCHVCLGFIYCGLLQVASDLNFIIFLLKNAAYRTEKIRTWIRSYK